MYVNMAPLVKALSKFNPTKEYVYFGRPGSDWILPRRVKAEAGLGTPKRKYHFAVGGMYCLSRALLQGARHYLV